MWRRFVSWVARLFGADEDAVASRAAGRARAAARGDVRRTYPYPAIVGADSILTASLHYEGSRSGWSDAERDSATAHVLTRWRESQPDALREAGAGSILDWARGLAVAHVETMRRGML